MFANDRVGKGKNQKDLTDNELDFLDEWKDLRDIILNKSNAQLRSALSELAQYDVTWNRNKVFFKVGEKNDQ